MHSLVCREHGGCRCDQADPGVQSPIALKAWDAHHNPGKSGDHGAIGYKRIVDDGWTGCNTIMKHSVVS